MLADLEFVRMSNLPLWANWLPFLSLPEESGSNEPNYGFYQSKLDLKILGWLREKLDGPTQPLPGAGSHSDAWARGKLYCKVKSNAGQQFKWGQAFQINTGKI